LSGRVAGASGDTTVFKSVGCALEDLIAAEIIAKDIAT